MEKLFFTAGSLIALLGVAAGAFGGHILKRSISPEMYDVFEVGVRYHIYHALALLAASWACQQWPGPWSTNAGWCFLAGIVLFSGSLYFMSLSGMRWLGAVTPIGGLAFMVGWFCLAVAAWTS
jgi:uncharacterized membrane protein YgdD (TMEM256/DUF423 family)